MYLLRAAKVHSKIEGKIQRFLTHSFPPHMHSLPHYQHSHQRGTFATIDEPTWACHYHPKSIVDIGFILGGVYSMGLDPVQFFFSKFVLCVTEFPFDHILFFSVEIFFHIFITTIFPFWPLDIVIIAALKFLSLISTSQGYLRVVFY